MKMTKMMAVALVLACLVSANTVSGEALLVANGRSLRLSFDPGSDAEIVTKVTLRSACDVPAPFSFCDAAQTSHWVSITSIHNTEDTS